MLKNDEHQTMLQDCIRRATRMNSWEDTFITSLKRQVYNEGKTELTVLQLSKLEGIWDKVTA